MKRMAFTTLCGALLLAAAPSPGSEIMRLEQRWNTAILEGDRPTVAAILSPNFKHFTSDGSILDRAQELAMIEKEPFSIVVSEETVDFDAAGDSAVLHGVNTITQPGEPVRRQRWTNVFFKQNGTWMAVSAQESGIVP